MCAGDSDELVPTEHMKRLHALATASSFTDFFSVRGGTHNDTWERAGAGYYKVGRQSVSGYVSAFLSVLNRG